MELTEYVGTRHPNEEATVARATPHYRWKPAGVVRARCRHCGTELELSQRHVLVTLSQPVGGDERHHLCDEQCVDGWLSED
ncbi:DUF7576 family protein [Halobaculum sp. D14]|uniref:DUF7576 family protein n=1 Tax=unclassified Halobaculum TaxID=2640896 RepID=UPI003EC10804